MLAFAKGFCDTLVWFYPAGMTPFLQPIDDEIGQNFRSEIYVRLDAYFEQHSEISSMPLSDKRMLIVELTAQTLQEWSNSKDKAELIVNSATRTGLRMILGPNPALRPVRFPEDFHLTLDPSSPLYIDDIVLNAEEEQQMDDGWSSEEAERVVNYEEADGSDEDERNSQEIENDESLYMQNARQRVRQSFCDENCSCERSHSRLCPCENSNRGYCTIDCGCDKSKCRAYEP